MADKKSLNLLYYNEEKVNYREKLEKYLVYWRWFVLSIAVCFFAGFFYLKYTTKIFSVSTTILIDDEYNSGLIADLSVLEELGVVGKTSTLVENEIGILKSRSLMTGVIKELEYNVSYFQEQAFKEEEIFKDNLPFRFTFFNKDSLFYELNTSFKIETLSQNSFRLVKDGIEDLDFEFGENINFGNLNFTVTPNSDFKFYDNEEFIVQILPLRDVADFYRNKLNITFLLKDSDILLIKLRDNLNIRGQRVLNTLTKHYNLNAIELKSIIAVNTNQFIKERLDVIEKDLSKVDKGVQQFKTSHSITDISTESTLILEASSELEKNILDINTQIRLADYVADYLKSNPNEIIPSNLGLGEGSLETNTLKYNELLLERNRILKSSKEQNPVILNLNTQVDELRNSVIQSLINLQSSLKISLEDLKTEEKRLNKKIKDVPLREKQFRDIERQQKIYESLYLYLLKKREENSISLAATMPNAKIVDKAMLEVKAIFPVPFSIYIFSIIIGCVIPVVVLSIKFIFDSKIHNSEIVEDLIQAPFLGEIPKVPNNENFSISSNTLISEAFRMLRTNINFVLSNVKSESKVLCVTSTIPGEGKTFVVANLSSILSLSGKKVLLIGADIRKPQLVNYFNLPVSEIGLSNYLMNDDIQVEKIIDKYEDADFSIDIIQSGIIPPNPSELLMKSRFDELLEYGKKNYDYVVVDTAPVNYVSDTLVLGQKSDMFIYVVRANYLDERLLEVPKRMYEEKRLPNMALLLNSVDQKKNKGYRTYGYGGYGYGDSMPKRPLWKKILGI